MKRIIILSVLSFATCVTLFGQLQYKSKYPDIPIVDVHFHPSNWRAVSVPSLYIIPPVSGPDSLPVNSFVNVMKVREVIKQKYESNLGYFICLNNVTDDERTAIKTATNNRVLFSIHAGITHLATSGGLNFTAEEVIEKVRNEGFVGLKFWFGAPYRQLTEPKQAGITRIDDPRFAPLFSKLEKANVLITSLHNADPNGPFDNRQNWMKDPVYYWEQIRFFENVVAKYPNLTFIVAHGAWLVCQDAQFDYLRYMLSTYPNLYIDISATFQYMPLSNRDNIRDFYIEYQDRILYGTDTGRIADDAIDKQANMYVNTFMILETGQDYTNNNGTMKGLDLPREVLEKIYYKNAVKLYPGLKEAMEL
ncbi:MAG: amidohydrolase [Tannerellaceae bacterium]|jgi:predicted TIM-barrel fold metal-dependent hydrolase|nr:amidohydrolase [Tannerellaceae bacterium]